MTQSFHIKTEKTRKENQEEKVKKCELGNLTSKEKFKMLPKRIGELFDQNQRSNVPDSAVSTPQVSALRCPSLRVEPEVHETTDPHAAQPLPHAAANAMLGCFYSSKEF